VAPTATPIQTASPTSSPTPTGSNFNLQPGTLWIVAAVVILVVCVSAVLAAVLVSRRRSADMRAKRDSITQVLRP
jgi:hypothetical protein